MTRPMALRAITPGIAERPRAIPRGDIDHVPSTSRMTRTRSTSFPAPAVLRIQAPRPRLRLVFQQQYLVDDRHLGLHLNLHERAADRLADVRRMHRFPAQDHPQANDARET
jgi:hypothetical protein